MLKKNYLFWQKGVTLIEIMIVLTIITIVTGFMISDFPKIKAQLSLSRAVYMITQDIKLAQDMSGSGNVVNISGNQITPKGYGFFADKISLGDTKYIIYADIDGDKQYNQTQDYIYREIDMNNQEPGIIISQITGASSRLSINFAPPNFETTISNLSSDQEGVNIIISIANYPGISRTIYLNKAGLIDKR